RPNVEHRLVHTEAQPADRIVLFDDERHGEIALGEALHRVEHLEHVSLEILLRAAIAVGGFGERGVHALEAFATLALHAQSVADRPARGEEKNGAEPPRGPEWRHDLDRERGALGV